MAHEYMKDWNKINVIHVKRAIYVELITLFW